VLQRERKDYQTFMIDLCFIFSIIPKVIIYYYDYNINNIYANVGNDISL
jgi:hypothetical protein